MKNQSFIRCGSAQALLLLFSCTLSAQTTWTLRNQSQTSNDILWSVTEGNAGVVSVGDKGIILHSLDGRTWTRRSSGTTEWLVAVTFGNGRYVAVGDKGTIISSTNAITWTAASLTGTTARLNNVLFAQGRFVAVGEGGSIVVSVDANTWNPTTSGITGAWLRGLANANGLWLVTGQGGVVTVSLDGLAWTKRDIRTSADLEAVVYTGESYDSGTYSYASDPTKYRYTSDTFLAVGANSTTQVLKYQRNFRDGVMYSDSLTPYYYYGGERAGTPVQLRSLSVANNVFITAGEGGKVFTAKSAYGPWSQVTTINTTKTFAGAGYALGSILLVGVGETIVQSEPILPSRLGNIATRGIAGSGSTAMIAGTVVQGSTPKQLLVRGIGPTLAGFGVAGVLADPVLSVYDVSGRLIATNSNWSTNLNDTAIAAAAARVGAFPLAAGSKDGALLITLNPGAYTFQLGSISGASGNALVEAYDLDPISASSPRAINIATRGQVGAGDDILIAGIVVQGQASRTLLVRGVGPTLSAFGVGGTLADPILKVVDSSGTVLALNDNWTESTTTNGRVITSDDVSAAGAVSGAFSLAAGSKDAATIITLVPGNYTIQVSGANNGTGLALVEVYDIPSR